MKYFIVKKGGYCLIGGEKSRWELRAGDIITTEWNEIYGEMLTEVHGSFNMKFYPIQLRVAKITKFNQYTGIADDKCSNEHPNFNPKEICFCVIHAGILSEITKSVTRQKKLEVLGI